MSINTELLRQARYNVRLLEKSAFVSVGDPALGGDPAAAGGAPPMDPAAGGAPPMDPAAGGAPPMDPAAAGGAPPMDPAAGGGGDPMAALMPMIQMAVQQAMAANGGGAQSGPQSGGAGIKPKIDVNVEIMQIKKMLAKIVDAMGINIPVADMVATPDDLNQIAQGGAGYAAMTPEGGGLGQIKPIQPMKSAEAWETGVAYDMNSSEFSAAHASTKSTANLASALILRNRARA